MPEALQYFNQKEEAEYLVVRPERNTTFNFLAEVGRVYGRQIKYRRPVKLEFQMKNNFLVYYVPCILSYIYTKKKKKKSICLFEIQI